LVSEPEEKEEFSESQKLIDECASNQSDVIIFIVGAANNAQQAAPEFIFKNFAPTFAHKTATIILVSASYNADFAQQGEKGDFIAAIKNLPWINDTSSVKNENNIITFDRYPNVIIKFFGVNIPRDPRHYLFNHIRKFFAEKIRSCKNVFIGWRCDVYANHIPLGLSDIYFALKKQSPDNIFFYCTAASLTPWCLIYDSLKRSNLKPLAKRFFSELFMDLASAKYVCEDLDLSQFSETLTTKRPFLLCDKLNFIFISKNEVLEVSLKSGYLPDHIIKSFWEKYIKIRCFWIDTFKENLAKLYAPKMTQEKAKQKVETDLEALGSYAKIDAEPAAWEDAVAQSGLMTLNEYRCLTRCHIGSDSCALQ
jgi:hypothetical protein